MVNKIKEKLMEMNGIYIMAALSVLMLAAIILLPAGRADKAAAKEKDIGIKPSVENVSEKVKKAALPNEIIPLTREHQEILLKYTKENNIPFCLALAVIEQESCFNPDADGEDSFGLMQINLCHGPKEIIIQPETNIKTGCWLLGYLYREYGNWDMALVAYNCGEKGAEDYFFSKGRYNSSYSNSVMEKWQKWECKLKSKK